MEKSKLVATLAAAAAAMFLAGTGAAVAEQSNSVKSKCAGSNACKGQGACGSNMNACKGSNACKGQGWEMLTLKECVGKKGRA
jgi:hypothetical protein